MTRQIRILILFSIAVFIGGISFGILTENGWGMVLCLAGIFGINYGESIDKRRKWNHGISKVTNKPWEFSKTIEFTDASWYYIFISDTESLCVSPNDCKISEYKGQRKIYL